MRFARILLGLGGSLGAWLVFLSHALLLAALPRADCDPGSDEIWIGTLVMGLLTGASAALLGLGLPWRSSLRWVGVLALPLAAYAAALVAPMIGHTTVAGGPLCAIGGVLPEGTAGATRLQRVWPPVQLAVLAFASLQALRYWLPTRADTPSLASG